MNYERMKQLKAVTVERIVIQGVICPVQDDGYTFTATAEVLLGYDDGHFQTFVESAQSLLPEIAFKALESMTKNAAYATVQLTTEEKWAASLL